MRSEPVLIRKRGVVAVIARENRLLVIRRSQHVRAPGMHCFPGGTIEPGEGEQQAVIREMQEELNAAIVAVRPLWRYVTSWGVDLAWWMAELSPEAELLHNPAEVEAFYWLTLDEIRALPQILESNLHFLDAHGRGEFTIDGLMLP